MTLVASVAADSAVSAYSGGITAATTCTARSAAPRATGTGQCGNDDRGQRERQRHENRSEK
jgi:hypothetical protein